MRSYKFILINAALLLTTFFAKAQYPESAQPLGTKTGAVKILGRGYVDTAFYIPTSIYRNPLRPGMIAFDSVKNSFGVWNGSYVQYLMDTIYVSGSNLIGKKAGQTFIIADLSSIGGGDTWGTITGILSDQTDLQTALDGKVPTSRTITINGTLHDLTADQSWTISGSGYGIDTTQIDVFLIAGQSNALGHGDKTLSPAPKSGTAYQYYNNTISTAVDPIGGAANGSAWPAFAISYYNRTGHKILLVPAAVGSTSQTAAADAGFGNWDTTGTLYSTSVSLVNAALDSASNRGYNPTFKGVLWCQGEGDAFPINDGTITLTDYENALKNMIRHYRIDFGVTMPFYIFRTGRSTNTDIPYAQVRKGQEYVDSLDALTYIVFRNAVDFPSRGLQDTGVHYTQSGYNEMGYIGADNVLNSITSKPQASYIQSYKTGFGFGMYEPAYTIDVKDKIGINGTQVGYLPNQTTSTGSIIFGNSGNTFTSGSSNNTLVGLNAGVTITSANNNTATGSNALAADTSGGSNTANGVNALSSNTNGGGNTATGYNALRDNTTASFNTANGREALLNNTTGTSNTGVGHQALSSNKTGNQNTVMGRLALKGVASSSNVSGNTAIGFQAGTAVLTGADNNSLYGSSSGSAITTGNGNVLYGYASGNNITTGSQNVILGYNLQAQSATTSNQLSIANAIFGTGNSGTGTTVSTGNIGFFVTSPTARVGFPASSTSAASMRINAGTAPTSPNDGDIWNDATTHHVYVRLNGTTYQLDQQGAGTYEPVITAPFTTNKYWNGYKQFVALNTDSITQGSTNKFLGALTLTTTGTSGAATLTGTTLNIPQYSGGGTAANPTASIGLTAVNGSATTYMRSDAAPALDQSISPTWTGGHLFNGNVDLHSNVFMTGLTAGNSNTDSLVTINGNKVYKIPRVSSAPQTLTDASTTTWNCASGYNAVLAATSGVGNSRTLSITNAASGSYGTLRFVQDGTGNRTITLPANSKVVGDWGSGTTIFTSTAASAIDILTFYYDGSNYYWTIGRNYQ